MKKTVSLVSLLAVLLVASVALTYDALTTGTIILARHQQTKTLIQQNGMSNPAGCSSPSYYQLTEDDSEFAKRVNLDVETALATGQSVTFAITSCSSGGTTGYPVITESWLRDY